MGKNLIGGNLIGGMLFGKEDRAHDGKMFVPKIIPTSGGNATPRAGEETEPHVALERTWSLEEACRRRGIMVATLSFVLGLSCAAEARQSDIVISTLEEIAADFKSVPCRNRDRLDATKELLTHYGARSEMISVESHRNASNLVVTREGSSSDTILIGAHYDVAEMGCGAVDNWSGVVALAHLYRTIRSLNVSKRVLFVAFGGEERGLLGSAGMANAIPDEELTNYCAMINLDSFGLAWPYATMEISSPTLVQLAEEVADDMEIPFRGVRLPGTGSDSSSFLERGIPAITLSGLSNDWRQVIHTVRDQPDKVNSAGVFLGYRLALSLWHRIEQAQCNAFR